MNVCNSYVGAGGSIQLKKAAVSVVVTTDTVASPQPQYNSVWLVDAPQPATTPPHLLSVSAR